MILQDARINGLCATAAAALGIVWRGSQKRIEAWTIALAAWARDSARQVIR